METDLALNKEFMDLYSRQIGAYGIETMGKLVNMKVVLVGMQGVGVETAKNLILAGPGSVVLCDDEPTSVSVTSVCVYMLCDSVLVLIVLYMYLWPILTLFIHLLTLD